MNDKDSTRTGALGAIGPLNKGLGFLDRALEPNGIAQLDWNLLR